MSFIPITINKYVKKHLESNPTEVEKELRKNLKAALTSYKNGEKCSCGNDIWVIGSAAVGNSCFTCITGEGYPSDDYEIDEAVIKRESITGRKNIDEMDPAQIAGFFDDEGYEIDFNSIKKPSLCVTCVKDGNPHEELFCDMTRNDQKNDDEFICYAFEKIP